MALSNVQDLCRLCLESAADDVPMYELQSDFPILQMESGQNITIQDALSYISLDIKVILDEHDNENYLTEGDNTGPKLSSEDSSLPKSLCQNCLEKLQSAYEFKLRCEENRNYLKEYLIDFENTRAAEERAAKQAAFQELDIDLDNLDALPDKLVLKPNMGKKPRKPRAPRDPAKGPIVRRKRINEKDIIIAENSEKDTAAYVRTVTRNSLQSLEEKGTSKRKSKHVIIQDIEISTPSSKTVNNYSKNGVRKVKRDYKETVYTSNDESIEQKDTNDSSKTESEVLSESDMSEHPAPKRKKKDMNESSKTESEALSESDASEQQAPKKKMTKTVRPHDEPVFEDDSDFEEEYTAPKREKRSRK